MKEDISILTDKDLHFYCKICKETKPKDNFYKFIRSVDNLTLKEEYISELCKSCLPIEAIYLDIKSNYKINQKILQNNFYNKQLEKLRIEHNLTMGDLISRSEAMKQLELNKNNSKDYIKLREKMGLLTPIKFYLSPGNYENRNSGNAQPQFNIFYSKVEFYKLKNLYDNGFLTLRTQKVIDRSLKENIETKNVYFSKDGRQFLYVNITKQEKPCANCLEIKPFLEFYTDANTQDKCGNLCKDCVKRHNQKRYDLLPIKEKEEKRQIVKNWKKENKDKVKQYIKKQRNKIENRIKTNLRKRVQNVVKAKINNEYIGRLSWKSWTKEFGCNKYELIIYLESKFQPGMTWQNYGQGKGKWEIDHIKAVSNFDFNNPEEIIKINHHTNLLPMWSEDNNDKTNKEYLCPINDKELLEKYKELNILVKKDNIEYDNVGF